MARAGAGAVIPGWRTMAVTGRTEPILAAAGLGPAQIASLRALVNDATPAVSSAREESVIDRARATLIARSRS